ncbi:rCG41286 [Rattus norvegicus]|uniref:RCG41286 n=1 Tax=Rattus norvegicus TaxID=10116 RepID=A6KNC1_RAT|nr:rCG41286 [Rattus norvegicus]
MLKITYIKLTLH